MIPKFVEELNITDAEFDEKSKRITFYTEYSKKSVFRNEYRLFLKEIEGTYYPETITHKRCFHECYCGFTGETRFEKDCKFLNDYVDDIYERIKDHPKIRLHLLFL